jgi:hypothetical protein
MSLDQQVCRHYHRHSQSVPVWSIQASCRYDALVYASPEGIYKHAIDDVFHRARRHQEGFPISISSPTSSPLLLGHVSTHFAARSARVARALR